MIRNIYDDTAQTSGYYYYRFIDSVNSVNFLYSDPIPWAAVRPRFEENEVGEIIEQARRSIGKDWSTKFSKEDAITEVNSCLIYMGGKLKRWARYLNADHALGQTTRVIFDYAMPADIYDSETNRSILQVRMVGQNTHTVLVSKDEKEFDSLMGPAKQSTVLTQPSTNQNTLEIVNSYDFTSSGAIHVCTSNTDDVIDYTGVTRSATVGVFTGVSTSGDGAIDATHAVGQNVWQNHDEGRPLYFNVRE